MSEPNSGDPIGDAPDADPELTRSGQERRRSSAVWVAAAILALIVVVILILVLT
jgi:Na+/melibiose symporter-like transporter